MVIKSGSFFCRLSGLAAGRRWLVLLSVLPLSAAAVNNALPPVRYQVVQESLLRFAESRREADAAAGAVSIKSLKLTTERQLIMLLHNLSLPSLTIGSDTAKLNFIYKAFMDKAARERRQLLPLQALFGQIDALTTKAGLINFLAAGAAAGRGQPFFVWTVTPDYADSRHFALYLLPPALKLTQATSPRRYEEFVGTVLSYLKIARAQELAVSITALEQKIEILSRKADGRENPDRVFTRYTWEIFQKKFPAASVIFLQPLLSTVSRPTLVLNTVTYFSALEQILGNTDLATLKAYLKYYYFCRYADFLDSASYALLADFTAAGDDKPELEQRAVNFVNNYMGAVLGELYVSRYFKPAAKTAAAVLVSKIKAAARREIEQSSWRSLAAKNQALKKLAAINVEIAYPKQRRIFTDLQLPPSADNLVQIVDDLNAWQVKEQIKELNTTVSRQSWDIYPHTIDAYYDVLRNEVIYPAALLQPPFYDSEAPAAQIWGTLGALMAHEITHAFDFIGKNYDEYGTYRPDAGSADNAAYARLKKQLLGQYNRYNSAFATDNSAAQNIGAKTLNENLADIGGLRLALSAWQEELSGVLAPGVRQEALQKFFRGWMQLFNNAPQTEPWQNAGGKFTHMPDIIRAWAPLLNFAEFYQVFNLKKDNKLYLKEEDRVKIW